MHVDTVHVLADELGVFIVDQVDVLTLSLHTHRPRIDPA